LDLCEKCSKKLDKPEKCPYCEKHFCSNCYDAHMSWEKQHQDWGVYQTSPAAGISSHAGLTEIKAYGPVYQTEQPTRRYRRSRRR